MSQLPSPPQLRLWTHNIRCPVVSAMSPPPSRTRRKTWKNRTLRRFTNPPLRPYPSHRVPGRLGVRPSRVPPLYTSTPDRTSTVIGTSSLRTLTTGPAPLLPVTGGSGRTGREPSPTSRDPHPHSPSGRGESDPQRGSGPEVIKGRSSEPLLSGTGVPQVLHVTVGSGSPVTSGTLSTDPGFTSGL